MAVGPPVTVGEPDDAVGMPPSSAHWSGQDAASASQRWPSCRHQYTSPLAVNGVYPLDEHRQRVDRLRLRSDSSDVPTAAGVACIATARGQFGWPAQPARIAQRLKTLAQHCG